MTIPEGLAPVRTFGRCPRDLANLALPYVRYSFVLRYTRLMDGGVTRKIIHIDLDTFFASVEQRMIPACVAAGCCWLCQCARDGRRAPTFGVAADRRPHAARSADPVRSEESRADGGTAIPGPPLPEANAGSWDEAVIREHGREGQVSAEPDVRERGKVDRGMTEDGRSGVA